MKEDEPWLILGENIFVSRLLIGTEQYSSSELIYQTLKAAGADTLILTISKEKQEQGVALYEMEQVFNVNEFNLICTTSQARTPEEAIEVARHFRSSMGIRVVKLDVRFHLNHAFPDNVKTIELAKLLVDEGFYVLPLIVPDPLVALELEKIGCSVLRLMASPVGSELGLQNQHLIEQVIANVSLPTIVECGIGVPSHAALAMEIGASGVLVNSAIVHATDSILMAQAMKAAVMSGRMAYLCK